MANRRYANSVAKKLKALDQKVWKELEKRNPNEAKMQAWEKQQKVVLKEAKRKLQLVSVPVADGVATYWETKRTTRLATFEWLWGGGDEYVSPWGKVVAIPVDQADKMIRRGV
jgi:signal recognition particle subunit SEC65